MAGATQKPTVPFVLGFMGGVIDAIVAAGIVVEAPSMSSLAPKTPLPVGIVPLLTIYGALGVVLGLVSIASSILLYLQPLRHRMWGSLVLIFALLSWFGSFGGGVIGSILGLIGGVSGLRWTGGAAAATAAPYVPTYGPMPPQVITRICPTCGRVLTNEMRFCPYCGRSLQ